MKKNSLNSTLNKIVNFKLKAKKEDRHFDEAIFRCIELKLIKKLKKKK